MTQIKGSVCIVTGAGSGIGRELAVQSVRRGACRVIATDVSQPGLDETCRIVEGNGGRLEGHQFDIGNRDHIQQFVEMALATLGSERLVLFNNAGMALCSGRFQDTSMDEFQRLLEVNLLGVIRLTKGFYSYLLDRDAGHIINISSVFGLGGMDCQAAYSTSKFAVRGFTETLRMELLDSNVHVPCVHPGGIKTNIVRNSNPTGPMMTQERHDDLIRAFDKIAQTTAEKAAQKILDAVERKRTRLVIGLDGMQFDWVTRIFPVRYTSIINRMYRRKMANPYDQPEGNS